MRNGLVRVTIKRIAYEIKKVLMKGRCPKLSHLRNIPIHLREREKREAKNRTCVSDMI